MPVRTGGSASFQYIDVGVNINCILTESREGVLLRTTTEISSINMPEATAQSNATEREPLLQPAVRQVRSIDSAFLTMGKPQVLSSLDDVSSSRRFQIEVTATKLK